MAWVYVLVTDVLPLIPTPSRFLPSGSVVAVSAWLR